MPDAKSRDRAAIPFALVFYGGGGLASAILLVLPASMLWGFFRYLLARDDFLAAVAHDLTTPLVGMRMMIGRNDEEAKRLNERMLLIVSNIKDFMRLGGKRRNPDLRPVDIVALTQEAYELFSADYADSEGVAFQVTGFRFWRTRRSPCRFYGTCSETTSSTRHRTGR